MANPTKLYILSPHIDDAAFGLALTISACAHNDTPVTIINCFTVTKWTAIPVENKAIDAVSLMRKSEDAAFYSQLHRNIQIVNLDLLDAPLRNGYIFQEKPFQQNELELVDELKEKLKEFDDGLLLCPLAIGSHIDHAICRAAVEELYKKLKVLFYEDLPYAKRISKNELDMHVEKLEQQLSVKLFNNTDGLLNCRIDKEQAIRLYKSQMNDEIASEIVSHLSALKGERIWGEEANLEKLRSLLLS